MQKIIFIGNLVHNPEMRTTPSGINVTTFTVAVNRRGADKQTDYFRVSVWRQLAESCAKYLSKGKKVCVVGEVSVRAYEGNNGEARAQMEVNASEVEFLSPIEKRDEDRSAAYDREQRDAAKSFIEIEDDDLPFC